MNTKAEFDGLVKILIWIVFFLVASYGVYSLIKIVTSG